MSDANKAIVHRLLEELWTAKNTDVIDELYASDCVIRNPDGDLEGPDGLRQLFTTYTSAFPDAEIHLDGDIVTEGDLVATPYVFTGTHQGELNGIAPTGRQVRVTGTAIARVTGGKIREERSVWDTAGMLQQLGVLPT